MIERNYADFSWEQAAELLAIDSPSGYTAKAAEWVKEAFEKLGFDAKITVKGGVLIDLGGEDVNDGLLLEAHGDTLGAMVAEVKGNGCLRYTQIGGYNDNAIENENVVIHTRFGKTYTGTVQSSMASSHVWGDQTATKRGDELLEIVSVNDKLRICFGVNHLLLDDHMSFMERVKDKLITVHISDYDFIQERHWFPGEGKIDWPAVSAKFDEIGYQGAWMYELSPGTINDMRTRPLEVRDFYNNAMEIFAGKNPTRI